MTSVHLDEGIDHVFLPGSVVKGRIRTNQQIKTSSIDVVLTGTLRIIKPNESLNSDAELTFLEITENVYSGSHTIRAGNEWAFGLQLPTAIDWEAVEKRFKGKTNSPILENTNAAKTPTQLPPSMGRYDLGFASIIYELRAACCDSNGSSNKYSSKPHAINLSPPRTEETPEPKVKSQLQRFSCHALNLNVEGGNSRPVRSKFSDFFHSKVPPFYQFSLQLTVPTVVVAGNKLRVKIKLNGEDTISSGKPAPTVVLEDFQFLVKSYTKVDGPTRLNRKRQSDSGPNDNVHVVDAQIAKIKTSIDLRRGRSIDMRDYCPNIGPWTGEIPTFKTYGIDRSFRTEISGVVSVKGNRFKFRSESQRLEVMSSVYRPPPTWKPVTRSASTDSEKTLPGGDSEAVDFASPAPTPTPIPAAKKGAVVQRRPVPLPKHSGNAAATATATATLHLASMTPLPLNPKRVSRPPYETPDRNGSFDSARFSYASSAATDPHSRTASFDSSVATAAAAPFSDLPEVCDSRGTAPFESRRLSQTPTYYRGSIDCSTVAKVMEDELFL